MTWPLFGRDQEIAFARDLLARDDTRGLVLAGDAGVGKTRLARELSAEMAAAGWAVDRVNGTRAARPIAFGAMAHLVPVVDANDRSTILGAAVREVVSRASSKGLVLVLDDAHHLDDASATLVHHVAASGRVKLLVTVRTGEVSPDPITALWKDGDLGRLEVQGFGRADVDDLLGAVLGAPVARETLDRLWRVTGGNALFLHQLIDEGLDTGRLTRGDTWEWVGDLVPGSGLIELVESQFSELSREQRQVLEVLAIAEPLGHDLLVKVADRSALDALERRALIAVERNRRRVEVRLGHPIYGDVLRARLPVTEHRRVCAALAAALQSVGACRIDDPLRLAHWQLEAGDLGHIDLLTLAATRAAADENYGTVERFARASMSVAPTFPAGIGLLESLLAQGRYDDAGELLDVVVPLADSDHAITRVAVARAIHAFFGNDDVKTAIEILDAARAAVTDEGCSGYLAGQSLSLLGFAGHTQQVRDIGVPLLDHPDDRARVRIVTAVAVALAANGQVDRSTALIEELFDTVTRVKDQLPQGQSWAASTYLNSMIMAGQLSEAENVLELIEATVNQSDRPPAARGFPLLARGRIALLRGQAATARRQLGEAAVLLQNSGNPGQPAWVFALLAEAAALGGDQAAATTAAAESVALARSALVRYDSDRLRALAWVRLLRGERSAAVEQLERIADEAAADGQHVFEATARHDAMRAGAVKHAPRLAELGSIVQGRLVPALGAHAAAVLAADPMALDDAATTFADLGLSLHAAEASAAAAALYTGRALRARAAAANRRAAEHLSRCEGARPPTIDHVAEQVGLSRREREVAELAATGLSNREIADRLAVSVRTVETHLYQAFGKLGVTDRRELGTVLTPARNQ